MVFTTIVMINKECVKHLDSGSFKKVKEGYILITYKSHPVIDLEEVKCRDQAILELCNNKPTPLLIDTIGSLINYTTEAREYMANMAEIYPFRKAEAFIISKNNVGLKLLVNNYIQLNKDKCPVKIFDDKIEATNWVRSFL